MITTENKTRTRNDIKQEWEDMLLCIMKEVKEYHFEGESEINLDDFIDFVREDLWDTIDQDSDIIYTHKAKEVSQIIGIYDCFDRWEDFTGERFDNWSQVAFANVYQFINNEIDVDETCKRFLKI